MDGVAVGDEVFGSVGKRYLGGGSLAEFTTMATGTIRSYPLAQAAQAFEQVGSGHTRGKVVVVP